MGTTLVLHVYFLWAVSGEKMRRNVCSFIYHLEGETFQENKEGGRMMCVKQGNPEKDKSAIVGMGVELLNVINWLVMFKLK